MRGNLDLILRAREAEAQRDRLAKALRDMIDTFSHGQPDDDAAIDAIQSALDALAEYEKEQQQ